MACPRGRAWRVLRARGAKDKQSMRTWRSHKTQPCSGTASGESRQICCTADRKRLGYGGGFKSQRQTGDLLVVAFELLRLVVASRSSLKWTVVKTIS